MNITIRIVTGLLLGICCQHEAQAGLSDYLEKLQQSATTPAAPSGSVALSNSDMVAALKEALDKGTQYAVQNLGRDGGFLDNPAVRIPMPKSLSMVEKSLRALHQDRLADEFIVSMNHAAEQAVPEAADLFTETIRNMTLDDAQGILSGPDDAATQFFRSHTEATLTQRMLPIVNEAMDNTGVTSTYKTMMNSAGGLTGFLSGDATDLDSYVTRQALDGLFEMIAVEEKQIRENPVARTSDLMKKVFGAYSQ
jgi:hypothetical protein